MKYKAAGIRTWYEILELDGTTKYIAHVETPIKKQLWVFPNLDMCYEQMRKHEEDL
jgi:hypothetical protein